MAKSIAIVNQKGGVGKTTTCVNLGAALTSAGKRVLICDFDPQANSTSGLGVDKSTVSPNVYDVLINGADVKRALVKTPYGQLIASNKMLSGAGIEMVGIENREYLLKNALQPIKDDFDFILIDCPPSLELLTLNALCAADTLMVPVQCEYYALEGLSQLIHTINLVKERLNPELDMEGVVFTMFDSRTNLSMQVVENVKENLNQRIYNTLIPRNIRLAEAPSHGMPISSYDAKSAGAEAYFLLADEVISNS